MDPKKNNTNAVTAHAHLNRISGSRCGKSHGMTVYPNSGAAPKKAKEQNMTKPSFMLCSTWSSSGTWSSNSCCIMTSTKKSSYLAMVSITVLASS